MWIKIKLKLVIKFIRRLIGLKLEPPHLDGLVCWHRAGIGMTVVDSHLAQWDDQSRNGNHLYQNGRHLFLESDGSILFDGVDNRSGAGVSQWDEKKRP